MNKGLSLILAFTVLLLLSNIAAAQVYKLVDKDGNVTYTDQPPPDGSKPMKLPELSVIESDYQPETTPAADAAADGDATPTAEPTPRELRKMYRDFRITRPAQEETFWGTANTVVVSWGSATALLPDMSVRLFVDGTPHGDSQDGMMAMTLDRGEHKVYAEMRDGRGRRVVVTETITFFVQQASVGFNQPVARPFRGS
jgi:hypothetical protein